MKLKATILYSAIAVMSLSASTFFNSEDLNHIHEPDSLSSEHHPVFNPNIVEINDNFYYGVDSRFMGIKKSELNKARSIHDFLSKETTHSIVSYQSVSIILIVNDKRTEIEATGHNEMLNKEQVQFLRSMNYSTNFLINVEVQDYNTDTKEVEDSYYTPHYTVVPEKQAKYKDGNDALVEHLRIENRDNVIKAKESLLFPAKLYFIVTKEGMVKDIRLDRSCNYDFIDQKIIELIKETNGNWIPAEDINKNKVDQELVVTYGVGGC